MSYNIPFASNVVTSTASILSGTVWGGTYVIDASTTDLTIILPTAVGNTGKTITVRHSDATPAGNQVQVTPFGTETVDGETSFLMRNDIQSAVFISDGTDVQIVANYRDTQNILSVSMTTALGLTAPTNVEFDTVNYAGGSTEYNVISGIASLPTGKRFRHLVSLSTTSTASTQTTWAICQSSDNTQLSGTGITIPVTNADDIATGVVLDVVLQTTTAANSSLVLRALTGDTTIVASTQGYSGWLIQELPA